VDASLKNHAQFLSGRGASGGPGDDNRLYFESGTIVAGFANQAAAASTARTTARTARRS
jgi:hypothetical protein